MILFLDDVRQPKDIGYDNAECVVVRNVGDAVQMYYSGKYDIISLDHDLGNENAGTGYDFLNFLEEKAYSGELTFLPDLRVHSANPVGRMRMAQVITKIQELFEKQQALPKNNSPARNVTNNALRNIQMPRPRVEETRPTRPWMDPEPEAFHPILRQQ